MAALKLVSSHLNINLVFPGGSAAGRNNNNFQQRRSAAGGVRRGKPSLGIVKCLDANTSILPVPSPEPIIPITSIKRDDFSGDFTFGASTSAIQTEGNLNVDGRGPSTLDDFIKADEGYNATDSYNLYLDDVKALKDMRMSAYRFSISWTRILPKGNLEGGINQKGIDFYNKLIDELVNNGIIPYVTLDHFEIPKALVESYSSFLDKRIIKDFKDYADVCFEKFGDRVKYWKTFNEPYYVGSFMWELYCEPIPEDGAFKATHNLILAHAHVVDLYRTKYKHQQGGQIGISLAFKWIEPFSSTNTEDKDAAQHCIDHEFGWYMDPLYSGEYPKSMRDKIPELPTFTEEETKLVKGSYDFLTLNYYHTYYAKPVESWIVDSQKGFVHQSSIANEGHAQGQQHDKLGNPAGFRDMLLYVKENYGNPRVVITENGWRADQEFKTSIQDLLAAGNIDEITKALVDEGRLYYIQTHLIALREALREGANITGYFVWSLLDNVEPLHGYYTTRYGLMFTDYLDYLNTVFGYLRLKYKEAEEDTKENAEENTEENTARRDNAIRKSVLAKERNNLDTVLLNNECLRKDIDKVKEELKMTKATHRVITDINVDLSS
nr:beta-glucosidase GH2 [Panax ginseng]